MLRINDATNSRRSAAGLSLIVGPLLLGVSAVISPVRSTERAALLDGVTGAPDAAQAALLLNFFGLTLVALGVLGGVHLVRRRGVVLAHLSAAIALVGIVSLIADNSDTAFVLSIGDNLPREVGVRVIEGIISYSAVLFLAVLALFATAGGLFLWAVALWRGGVAPVWTWPAILLAYLIFILEPVSPRFGWLAGDVLLVLALGWIGVRILRMSDLEWERGVGHASAPQAP